MMSRSMPFSLLTCSMTRFRSGSMAPSSPHGSALGRLTTQGETLDEARDMAKDAILSSLEALREAAEKILLDHRPAQSERLVCTSDPPAPARPPRHEGDAG